jgi:hypothetical protein
VGSIGFGYVGGRSGTARGRAGREARGRSAPDARPPAPAGRAVVIADGEEGAAPAGAADAVVEANEVGRVLERDAVARRSARPQPDRHVPVDRGAVGSANIHGSPPGEGIAARHVGAPVFCRYGNSGSGGSPALISVRLPECNAAELCGGIPDGLGRGCPDVQGAAAGRRPGAPEPGLCRGTCGPDRRMPGRSHRGTPNIARHLHSTCALGSRWACHRAMCSRYDPTTPANTAAGGFGWVPSLSGDDTRRQRRRRRPGPALAAALSEPMFQLRSGRICVIFRNRMTRSRRHIEQ